MKVTDTISVNPSKTALGHVETASSSILRRRVIDEEQTANKVDLKKIVFPTLSSGVTEYKKYEVPFRTLFATILIVSGLAILIGNMAIHSVGFAVATICFGGFLAIGLLTRPVMLGASIFYCIVGALSIRTGNPDLSVFSLMFGCLIFAVIGSGKYSCDNMIRHEIDILKGKQSNIKKEDIWGYKIFHNVKF